MDGMAKSKNTITRHLLADKPLEDHATITDEDHDDDNVTDAYIMIMTVQF